MTETVKTAAFLAGAAVLVIAAAVVQPESRTPSMLSDEGEAFYPKFKDPQSVRAIEVVDYDEPTATARPLKVEFRKSRWLIASNNDYPVDIGDRLVKTSAALIDLKKDQVRSDLVQDHARYGVIDPLDQKVSSLQGRGKRVTLRDAYKEVVADFILGKPIEGKPGWRYVRVPGGKRTYAVKTDADPSAKFADWVNAGLLRMPAASIKRITVARYGINSLTGQLVPTENTVLTPESKEWKSVTGTLDGLKIVDARPKPTDMASDLREGRMQVSMQTAMTLRSFGYLLTQTGRVLATYGEMTVEMASGVNYQIRFGEAAAGGDRYLFVTTSWDTARAARYGDTTGAGERTSRELNARFADWFYVISSVDYQQLRPPPAPGVATPAPDRSQ